MFLSFEKAVAGRVKRDQGEINFSILQFVNIAQTFLH